MQQNKKRLLLLGSCVLILAAVVLMACPSIGSLTFSYHPYYFLGLVAFGHVAPMGTFLFAVAWLLTSLWNGWKPRCETRNIELWVLAALSSALSIGSVFAFATPTDFSIAIAGLLVVAGIVQIVGCAWLYRKKMRCG